MRRYLLAGFLFACHSPTNSTNATQKSAADDTVGSSDCDQTVGTPAEWTPDETISPCGRPNPLALTDPTDAATRGQNDALHYPVNITAILLPLQPLQTIVQGDSSNPARQYLAKFLSGLDGIHSMDDLWAALGLVKGPDGTRWGETEIQTPLGTGVTFGCATCHTGSLFGTAVFGLFNRESRANHMFVEAKPIFEATLPGAFQLLTGASDDEKQMWANSRNSMHYVQSKDPAAQGLDTALAHTMLSLSLRGDDPWATETATSYLTPRYTELQTWPVDVKPATWWLTKYKTKYFSDGSLGSGNPVIGSLLVNELSRGTDLHVLDQWIDQNQQLLQDLTTAVFSAQPPSYFDYFDPTQFDMAAAQRGEVVFNSTCSGCHGTYTKGWDAQNASTLSLTQQLATTEVHYFSQTKVHDVGTDPDRAQGIAYMQSMNSLALAQKYNFVLTQQPGYVAPPLVGIFARWPYFHNGSAPSLCAVLTRATERPTQYTYGDVVDRVNDFDSNCNGYPLNPPASFTDVYDTTTDGLSNTGHDEGIFLKNGSEVLTPAQKSDLIRYLQTL